MAERVSLQILRMSVEGWESPTSEAAYYRHYLTTAKRDKTFESNLRLCPLRT